MKDGWTEVDAAVTLYEQNARIIEFFRAEANINQGHTQNVRLAKIGRDLLSEFHGYQRDDLANLIDRLESSY